MWSWRQLSGYREYHNIYGLSLWVGEFLFDGLSHFWSFGLFLFLGEGGHVLAVLEDVGHYGEDVVEFAHVVHEQG